MNLRNYKSVADRRSALEDELHVSLPNIGSFSLDEAVASSRNCENMVGVAQIPMGVAGPLMVCQVSGIKCQEYYLPLATTEGALVASVNRGCKAIHEAGGTVATAFRVGTTRGPVFRTEGLATGKKLVTFLYAHKKELDGIAAKTSRHIRLTDVVVKGIGKLVFVRLTFDTSEAMGMNMVTLATSAIASYVTQKTGARLVSLAGNYDSDKKPSWINFIRGRGWEVRAEATIPAGILQDTLKTTAKELYDVWLAKCMIGSAMTGSMGFNAHFANIIAALFLATGQDPAHVVEGSLGITTAEVLDSDLYISVFLPDLMVGTVGGGTGLATQKEALAIIGAKNTEEFARVVGAAALAGELSLLASLAEGTLAKSHKRLARAKT